MDVKTKKPKLPIIKVLFTLVFVASQPFVHLLLFKLYK